MRCSGVSSGWAATPRYKIRLFVFTDSLRAGDSPVSQSVATCRTKQVGREEVEEDSLHAASLEVAAQDCSGFGEEEIKCGGWIVVSLVQGVACISFAETHLDNLFHLVVNSYNLSHT